LKTPPSFFGGEIYVYGTKSQTKFKIEKINEEKLVTRKVAIKKWDECKKTLKN
jgi:hypothetical protein